jgi:hypothetical protein
MHMTYGGWGGAVPTVADGGLAHFVIGTEQGQWIQLSDTEWITYNVGNWSANQHSVAIEFVGINEDILTDWQCWAGSEVVRQVRDAHGVEVKYDDGADGANDVAPWSGWYAHRAIAADNPPQHFDFIDRSEWDRIVANIGTVKTEEEIKPRKKESEMFVFHNTDKHDPNKDTATGEYVMRIGYGLVDITAGEAYVWCVLCGVPFQDNCNTLSILRQQQLSARAQKSAQAALTGKIQ